MRHYKRGIFDIETNGLALHEIDVVHCLAIKLDDNEPELYSGRAEIRSGLGKLDECEVVFAHNGIAYDIPVLHKLFGWKPKSKIIDTMLLSQIVRPDRKGGHGLASWGQLLGEEKDQYKELFVEWMQNLNHDYSYTKGDEWQEYNSIMGSYCIQDVTVTSKLLSHLETLLHNPPEGVTYSTAIKIEHDFARYFARQAIRGVQLNKQHCEDMLNLIDTEMSRVEEEVEPQLPKKPRNIGQAKQATPPKRQFKADGTLTAFVDRWFDQVRKKQDGKWEAKKFGEWFNLPTPADQAGNRLPIIEDIPMQLKDQQDLKQHLMSLGWIPTMWNYKKKPDKNGTPRIVRDDRGNPVPTWPKFHEKGELCPNLAKLNQVDYIADVVKWVIYRHRRSIFAGLLENVRDDGRVSAQGLTIGTPTARVTHKVVANVPKASPNVILGKECRQAFTVRKGAVMAGVDAAGLEFRILAHYMNDPEFTKAVVEGNKEDKTDVHNLLLEPVTKYVKDRDTAKGCGYCFLYGGGDEKLGQTAGHGGAKAKKVGAKIRLAWSSRFPKLGRLVERLDKAADRGYVVALDGRAVPIRSPHAALNTLLQSGGSIVVKFATNYMNAAIDMEGLKAWQVIHYHDEVVLEASKGDATLAAEAFVEGLSSAATAFKLNCPMDGEILVGRDWSETH